jgi:hypothetical protein
LGNQRFVQPNPLRARSAHDCGTSLIRGRMAPCHRLVGLAEFDLLERPHNRRRPAFRRGASGVTTGRRDVNAAAAACHISLGKAIQGPLGTAGNRCAGCRMAHEWRTAQVLGCRWTRTSRRSRTGLPAYAAPKDPDVELRDLRRPSRARFAHPRKVPLDGRLPADAAVSELERVAPNHLRPGRGRGFSESSTSRSGTSRQFLAASAA